MKKDFFLDYTDPNYVEPPSFDPEIFYHLAQYESESFWFKARNRLLAWMGQKFLKKSGSFLEIGCGTGYVLRELTNQLPNWKFTGSDSHVAGLSYAYERLNDNAKLIRMDANNIPFSNEFDAIGAFDVMEHLENDENFLKSVHQALKDDGYLLISVPQHPWLWSEFDTFSGHKRRYVWSDLKTKLEESNFSLVYTTSFNVLLLPLLALNRWLVPQKNYQEMLKVLSPSPRMNFLLENVFRIELFFTIYAGIRWPIGGSRMVVCKRALSSPCH